MTEYYVDQCWPFPFVCRWRVYDKDYKWLATFKHKGHAIHFVELNPCE